MNKLKLCPFCAGEIQSRKMFGNVPGFLCDSCGAIVSFKGGENEAKAIAAWNLRLEDWLPMSRQTPHKWQKIIAKHKKGHVALTVYTPEIDKNYTHWQPSPE